MKTRRVAFMEGSLFFLFSWSLWIVTTFIMDKQNNIRTKYSIFILLFIITIPYGVQWGEQRISIVLISTLFISFYYISKLKWKSRMYVCVCSFFLMLAYVVFELMAILDPIWLLMSREWLKAVVMLVLVLILQKDLYCQILTLLVGNIIGEITFGLITRSFSMYAEIGSLLFFDSLLISVVSVITIFYIKYGLNKIEKYVTLLDKERTKNM